MTDQIFLTRRGILGGVLAAASIPIIAKPVNMLTPILYGDGLHDDWPAINALARGLPARVGRSYTGTIQGGEIRSATLLLSKPFPLTNHLHSIYNTHLRFIAPVDHFTTTLKDYGGIVEKIVLTDNVFEYPDRNTYKV